MPLFESNFERYFNIDEIYRVDLDTKRAEIVRGGTAPVYSNNASGGLVNRSEEHTSELQSLMRTSYAAFCLKQKTYQSRLTSTPTSKNLLNTTSKYNPYNISTSPRLSYSVYNYIH